jgi:hypothetical protein
MIFVAHAKITTEAKIKYSFYQNFSFGLVVILDRMNTDP